MTEDRHAFVPWLLWNFRKQDHASRELVVVDSSSEPRAIDEPDVIVVRCDPGTSVARKRNLALDAARGTFATWFDDDDWQHPRKLTLLAEALGADGVLAGGHRSWFVDLARGRARPHDARRTIVFNGLGARRSALADVRFDERRARAADTAWMTALRRSARCEPRVVDHVLSLWLCHRANISNPARRYVFPQPLGEVERALGPAAWGDTGEQIDSLRVRLGLA